MIIRCTNLGESRTTDGWLTLNNEYVVLGVYGSGKGIKYRVLNDKKTTAALHPSSYFEITCNIVPDRWIFRTHSNGTWDILPEAWGQEGFWEAYFNGEPPFVALFETTVEEISQNAIRSTSSSATASSRRS